MSASFQKRTSRENHILNLEALTFTILYIQATVRGGGSAVIVKTSLSHYEDVKIEKEEYQVTSVKLKTSTGAITVAAIYSPSRHNLKRGDYLSLLQSFSGKFIIGGDFNSKHTSWGSRLTNTKGNELHQAIQEYHCEVLTTGKPTYWPTDLNKIPDLIDFFLSQKIYLPVSSKSLKSLTSTPITRLLC